uniref:Tropomyosin n=1 Tax=Globodera pallida TaxID=36090 RepID=A0A183CEP2_GLOPA
ERQSVMRTKTELEEEQERLEEDMDGLRTAEGDIAK